MNTFISKVSDSLGTFFTVLIYLSNSIKTGLNLVESFQCLYIDI